MTTVPGTYFTQDQLEASLKVDKVSCWGLTGCWRMNYIGYKYKNEKKQYDKALAWYILSARRNDSTAQNNIGVLYYDGEGVPKNYLCALKWYLKSAQQNDLVNTASGIGKLFENGYGVPLDKYKALEWFYRDKDKTDINRLNGHGYHRYEKDTKKSLQQLIKETNAILESEKKKLEEKQHRTQEEIETLKQLNITYKLVDGGKDAWKDVPILLAASKQHSLKSVNSSATNNGNETHELKNQTQLSKQDKNNFEIQAKQLESFKQEIPDFELQVKEKHKDNELVLLRKDTQSLQRRNPIIQHQPQTNDSEINPLQSEIQKLKLTVSSLKHQVREKDAKIESFQTDNISLRHRIDGCEQQIKARDNKINLLESEKVAYHSTSMQQTQIIDSLKQEKQMVEQVKTSAINELEQLKASYTTLEQLLKAKEDTIIALNRENQMLSTVNQGNQQGPTDMVETLKNLLQNMENLSANEKQRIDALEEENRALKQERIQQQATIQNTGPLNDSNNPTNSNPIHSDQHDNSYNDLNYESEYSDTEESEVDDINYDTPSEDEDRNNDLNYDDLK